MHTLFVFDLGANQHVIYFVKDAVLPPSSSLLTAIGFEFTLKSKVAGGPMAVVLIPAVRLAHISSYTDFNIGDVPKAHEASFVNVIHR